ncbi:hypothetical protein M8C21_007029 [Ambrosia artemisiifolia]|uniref:Uncharacterized protein n=1 Tax=Ambrosia artemisiifolia TaxID=4212 RepID=A0AAD5C313_AMBAR|nr:hypothetical protein M8C21_007029 [Ambrosia artemisiifolia]
MTIFLPGEQAVVRLDAANIEKQHTRKQKHMQREDS